MDMAKSWLMIKQMKLSKKIFWLVLYKSQNNLEKSIRGSGFILGCINLLCYRCEK